MRRLIKAQGRFVPLQPASVADATSLDWTLAVVSKHLPVMPQSFYRPQLHNSRRGVAKVEGLSLVNQACEDVFIIELRQGEGHVQPPLGALAPGELIAAHRRCPRAQMAKGGRSSLRESFAECARDATPTLTAAQIF